MSWSFALKQIKTVMRFYSSLVLSLLVVLVSCKREKVTPIDKAEFRDRSNAEAFVTIEPEFASTVKAYTLISSSDTIKSTPSFIYGGAPDGQGF